ncbi:uncharacterized protein LOC133202663 [Saccostrea echinata]|uniref:uncharacterized protein LOC133202663 n=1 Tax=Saccostrea echinata TaxID=191078 RepID=UPI002A7FBD80|nr:uncharacterized protein LOC133202663 [Saccostrea echinata]
MPEKNTWNRRPWTLPHVRTQPKVHVPKVDTYFKEISECQKQYSKLRLTPEVSKHSSSTLPFLFPRSHTTSKIELKPSYARSPPATLSRHTTKLSWQLKMSDSRPNDSLDSDNLQLSEHAESVDEESDEMNPIKLSEHLRDSGFGDPIMLTWSAKEHLSKFNLPKGRRARKLPSNPSQREKIKGRARLDYEMANMRAVAFCERQAPKVFRTASANMRNRDVQFVEQEVKENIQREIELDEDDNDSIIVMKIDREELFQRVNTWIEDVTKSLAS